MLAPAGGSYLLGNRGTRVSGCDHRMLCLARSFAGLEASVTLSAKIRNDLKHMDITCPQCGAEYEFEDKQVTPYGVTVKCSSCAHVFRVRTRQVVETESASESPDNERLWMIKTRDGQTFKFRELPTLQQWIVERKVCREDAISRTGDVWKPLGEIAELSSFFQVVDAALTSTASEESHGAPPSEAVSDNEAAPPPGSAPQPDAAPQPNAPVSPGRSIIDSEPAFAANAQLSSQPLMTVGPRAAWEGGSRTQRPSGGHERSTSIGQTIGRLLLVGLLAGVITAAAVKWNTLSSWLSDLLQGQDSSVRQAYGRGRELFLRDDQQSLKRADDVFAVFSANSPLALAARAEVNAALVQQLVDQATILELRSRRRENAAADLDRKLAALQSLRRPRKRQKQRKQQLLAQKEQLLRPVSALARRQKDLRDKAKQLLQIAAKQAESATKKRKHRPEITRAVAEVRRLQGKQHAAIIEPLRHTLKAKPNDPEAHFVEGAYWSGQGDEKKALKALRTALVKTRSYTQQVLLRAAMRLAMLHLAAGRLDQSAAQANTVLSSNPAHETARLLVEYTKWARQPLLPKRAIPPTSARPKTTTPTASRSTRTVAVATKTKRKAVGQPKRSQPSSVTNNQDYASLIRSGERLSEQGETMKALRTYKAALALRPNGVQALTGLAYCQLDLQRYALAISGFRRAIRASPASGNARIGLAESYKAMGNKRQALAHYRAYLKSHAAGSKAALARRNVNDLQVDLGQSAADQADKTPAAATPSSPTNSEPRAPETNPVTPPPAP